MSFDRDWEKRNTVEKTHLFDTLSFDTLYSFLLLLNDCRTNDTSSPFASLCLPIGTIDEKDIGKAHHE